MKKNQDSENLLMPGWPEGGTDNELIRLQRKYIPALEEADFKGLVHDPAFQDTVVVSSFGAESAALLHYMSRLRPAIPVLFLDTGLHFSETLFYRDRLVKLLGLALVTVRPDPVLLEQEDPDGNLYDHDPNACCTLRKTFPLQDALAGYSSWISGRKRYQGGTRSTLPLIERDGSKLKLNPLAHWSSGEVANYFKAHDLPFHPLQKAGFQSIGCQPCTRAVSGNEDPRAGRWPQLPNKSECGIHLGPDGRFTRNRR